MFVRNDDPAQRWKRKYYDSLDELERKERRWGEAESLLYAGIGRLALAAYGFDSNLDPHLDGLRDAVRARKDVDEITALVTRVQETALEVPGGGSRSSAASPSGAPSDEPSDESGGSLWSLLSGRSRRSDGDEPDETAHLAYLLAHLKLPSPLANELDGLSDRLDAGETRAVVEDLVRLIGRVTSGPDPVDRSPSSPAEHSAESADGTPAPSQPLHETLRRLVELLELPTFLETAVEEVKSRLRVEVPAAEVRDVLAAIAGLVRETRRQTVRERLEMQVWLRDLTDRLQTLDRLVEAGRAATDTHLDSAQSLQRTVDEEVGGLRGAVEHAVDVETLKEQVSERLEQITARVDEFIVVEQRRVHEVEEQAAQLDAELRGVQAETSKLRTKLQKEHERDLRDDVTGVPSRAAFEEHVGTEYKRWKRYRGPLSVVLLDIDRFASINEKYGHQAGDRLLRATAELFARNKRDTDLLARYEGARFVMLMPGTPLKGALKGADKLRGLLEDTKFRYRGNPVPITISCGVAEFREGDTPKGVIVRADSAVCAAKRAGRNRCVREPD